MSEKKVEGLKDPGLKWEFRYLTRYVIKHDYPLLLLYLPIAAAFVGAAVMTVRGFFTPDVNPGKKNIPWDNLPPTYRFQLFSPNIDFKKLKKDKDCPKLD